MRRFVIWVACSTAALGACSSGGHHAAPAVSTTRPPTSVESTTTTTSPPSSSTAAATTTTSACPNRGSTTPVTTPQSQSAALLSELAVTTSGCRDLVVFGYVAKGAKPPSCTISYQLGPFSQDASGQPVAVAGSAFVVVRCSPAYGFDYETGTPTYTGPKRIAPTGTNHVRAVVLLGDNEGVLTWVVGLDGRRGFSVVSSGAPAKQLILTFS